MTSLVAEKIAEYLVEEIEEERRLVVAFLQREAEQARRTAKAARVDGLVHYSQTAIANAMQTAARNIQSGGHRKTENGDG